MKKFILCLNEDLFGNIALNFLKGFLASYEVTIILSYGVGKDQEHLQEIKFYEKEVIKERVFPNLDSEISDRFLSFEEFFNLKNYSELKIKNINDEESLQKIKMLKPDLIFSIRYGQIFKGDIIKVPKYGIVNLHSGHLPKYRGIMASLQAILHGEKNLSASLHYIEDAKIDAGPIIDIYHSKFNQKKSLFYNLYKLYETSCQKCQEPLKQILNGTKPKTKPNLITQGKYFSTPSQEDLQTFQQNHRLINREEYKSLIKQLYSYNLTSL